MTNTASRIVKVLLPVPHTAGFDYLLPGGEEAAPGSYVTAPFGKKRLTGVVWGEGSGEVSAEKCREVALIHREFPSMPPHFREFIDWVAWYNCASAGAVLKLALPLQDVFVPPKRKVKEKPAAPAQPPQLPELSPEQKRAEEHLAGRLGQGFAVEVLEGLTGSGKTEVYFDTIARALERGEQVLVLLPEIALGVQWVERCQSRFGFAPEIWHSGIGLAARKRAWKRAVTGEARLIVGARSALFLPMPRLGLIVVDEEHEPSYKQEDGVIYHARDMAVARAKQEGVPVVLVSATPSLETLANVEAGRYGRTHLTARYGGASLPSSHLVDMRRAGLPSTRFISPELEAAVREHVGRGEQALLFLNRRGYAPLLLCRACGHRLECPNCSSWMVLHKSSGMSGRSAGAKCPTINYIQCHHCAHTQRAPDACPSCEAAGKLAPCGPGVERIEEEARELFPQARLLTLASDNASTRKEIEAGIATIANREADIVIGTQLLAKGHHFPHLTLIGVVDADLGLRGGDLRATERTWQLLHQLSGRAGREEKPGRVLIQTWQPDHLVMQALAKGDGKTLAQLEMEARREGGMPPFGKLAAVIVEGMKEEATHRFAAELARILPRREGVRVLGPAPAPLYRLRSKYRLRFLIHARKNVALQAFLQAWLGGIRPPSSMHLKIDIDPQSFL